MHACTRMQKLVNREPQLYTYLLGRKKSALKWTCMVEALIVKGSVVLLKSSLGGKFPGSSASRPLFLSAFSFLLLHIHTNPLCPVPAAWNHCLSLESTSERAVDFPTSLAGWVLHCLSTGGPSKDLHHWTYSSSGDSAWLQPEWLLAAWRQLPF